MTIRAKAGGAKARGRKRTREKRTRESVCWFSRIAELEDKHRFARPRWSDGLRFGLGMFFLFFLSLSFLYAGLYPFPSPAPLKRKRKEKRERREITVPCVLSQFLFFSLTPGQKELGYGFGFMCSAVFFFNHPRRTWPRLRLHLSWG